jgi:uncharacterized membrane protein YqjE
MMIDKTDKSLGELFSDLTKDMVDIVRNEIALARAEMSEKMSGIQTALISLAVGAAILLAGLFILLLAVVRGLEMALPPSVAPWLAPLIVGLVVAGIGFLLLKGGSAKLSADKLMPHKTIDSLARDKQVVQEKL